MFTLLLEQQLNPDGTNLQDRIGEARVLQTIRVWTKGLSYVILLSGLIGLHLPAGIFPSPPFSFGACQGANKFIDYWSACSNGGFLYLVDKSPYFGKNVLPGMYFITFYSLDKSLALLATGLSLIMWKPKTRLFTLLHLILYKAYANKETFHSHAKFATEAKRFWNKAEMLVAYTKSKLWSPRTIKILSNTVENRQRLLQISGSISLIFQRTIHPYGSYTILWSYRITKSM